MNLVLIHGLIGHLKMPELLASFSRATVLPVDLIGYGQFRHRSAELASIDQQADHVAAQMKQAGIHSAAVAGHSVGGAVAVQLAVRHPELVQTLISIEGNITLNDAFWSADIAAKPLTHIENLMAGYKRDVAGWLASAEVKATPWTVNVAAEWLDNQPAETIRNQAAAVVTATAPDSYRDNLKSLAKRVDLPVHFIAGESSAGGWDVSSSLREDANSYTLIPDSGHLMMLDNPIGFAATLERLTVPRATSLSG